MPFHPTLPVDPPVRSTISTVTSLSSVLPQVSLFSPPLIPLMQLFTEQLRPIIPEASIIPTGLFFTSSTFALNPVNFGCDYQVELNGDIRGLNMNQFIFDTENDEETGMDAGNPILCS